MDAVRLDALEEEARRVLPPTTFAHYRQGARDGRLPLYALATGGEEGVRQMFGTLVDELEEALLLAGCGDLASTRDLIERRR